MIKPLLLNFAKPTVSPNRKSTYKNYFYDSKVDMVRWKGQEGFPFAIEAHDDEGPITKKADIEKGDDQKDRRMWK